MMESQSANRFKQWMLEAEEAVSNNIVLDKEIWSDAKEQHETGEKKIKAEIAEQLKVEELKQHKVIKENLIS